MRSSISSSKKLSFVVRTASFFLALLLFYGMFVCFLPAFEKGTYQGQTNIIKAQRYAFSKGGAPFVVLGSSEMFRLPVTQKNTEWKNLAMAGGASQTGLEIVVRKAQAGEKPKAVWIEMNDTLLRGCDQELLAKTSWWHDFPLLREYDRPDAVVYYMLNQAYKKGGAGARPVEKDNPALPTAMTMERVRADYDKPLDEEKFRKELLGMKGKIAMLREEGVKVFLCMTPNAPEVQDSREMQAVKRICQEVYPPEEYRWQAFDWTEYHTTDGIHLQLESADRLADEIIRITEQEL